MYDDSNTLDNSYKDLTLSKELLDWYKDSFSDTLTFMWNINDEIIYVSSQVEQYFDVEKNELSGLKWINFVHDEYVYQIKDHFRQTNDNLYVSNLVFKEYFKSSHIFNGSVDKILLGTETLYICQLKNMTHMNELKNFLVDTDKLIISSQLSAGMIHEIRNPLTSLKGFLQLIHAGMEQKKEHYELMIGEVDKLAQITNELLQMAKPKSKIKKRKQIQCLIDDVIFLFKAHIDMRQIDFICNIDEGLITTCNASQIKQVLLNLIKNAAESMDNKGLIQIDAYEKNDMIYILIIDEGEGLQDNQVNDLHQPFYTTKDTGTGLGLVVTEHILDNHGGKISAQLNELKGTTFIINLPNN